MGPKVVFDVSSLKELRTENSRPSGIQRVQLEAASVIARIPEARVEFCAFNRDRKVFERVPLEAVFEIEGRMRGRSQHPLDPRAKEAATRRRGLQQGTINRLAGRSPAVAAHLQRSGHHFKESLAEARATLAEYRTGLRSRGSSTCFTEQWSAETIYCSLGADWIDGDVDYLSRRKDEIGFRVVLTVYDLIPVVAPQFLQPWVDVSPHFGRVLRAADRILVISGSTRDDLAAYAAGAGLPMPETQKLPLGSDLVSEEPALPVQLEQAELRDGYVLTVGTVEIRKNHHLLLDVWEGLVREGGEVQTPRLVVAGQRGWLSAETIARLTRTPSLRGVVSFVEGPTDGELAWLYRNCAFTVYPALYEGWGLPVSESLDFGKMCITSNRSSLPEAGEGLTDLLDPFDRMEWKRVILHYWTDREALAGREEAIRRSHGHISSEDTAAAVIEATTFDAPRRHRARELT